MMERRTNTSSSSSSRTPGKKMSNLEKANRQPQRGLGVAQLEQIRLQSQMLGFLTPNPFDHHLNNISLGEASARMEGQMNYNSPATSNFVGYEARRSTAITLPLSKQIMEINVHGEDERFDSTGTIISQSICSSQELDLELKL